MDPRKPVTQTPVEPQPQTTQTKSTALEKQWAQFGAFTGVGFAAGLGRASFFKTLFTGAVAVPSLAAMGFFSAREYVRQDMPRKFAEFKQAGEQHTAAAREYVNATITKFRK